MDDLREQFLERLTRELFHKRGDGFVLKGGGALRALFGEQRLTKDIDLDFTNPKRSADSLHHSVRRAIDMAARGLTIQHLQVSEPGKTESSPRWKVNFEAADGRRQHIEIEVSRDPSRAVPGAVVQRPFVPRAAKGIARFWVDIYDEPALIASKIAALLGREVPRDVYDLDLLKDSAEKPSVPLIHWAVQRANLEGQNPVTTLWAHLDALNWPRFQSELLDALTPASAERMDETEWTTMKLRVGEYVERLLQAAST
ncbi:MAG: nucleotidyl transferase AbiEii/AbiGii toxin family protein [Gammaproteobacteria bacterium]